MTCPQCGHDNPADARFCATCGSPLRTQVEEAGQPQLPTPEQEYGDLPPRGIGGLLAETFAVYRKNFWPFVLIVLIAIVPQVPTFALDVNPDFGSGWSGVLLFTPGLLLAFIVTILIPAASVYAVAQHYAGTRIDVGECFKRAWFKVMSLVMASVLVALPLILLWVFILGPINSLDQCRLSTSDCHLGDLWQLAIPAIAIPPFLYLFVMWLFIDEAIMIEGRGAIAALGRSMELVRGSWWRVFGIVVVFVLILLGTSKVVLELGYTISIGLIVPAVATVLVLPILLIGRTLVYLDLRVRKEGYTLGALASEVRR